MTIRTLILDFGNVIGFFDHRLVSTRLARYSPLSAATIHGLLFGGALEDDFESGKMDAEAFVRQVRQACQLTCSDAVLIRAYSDIFWPNPEVCGLLPRLKARHRLVLASNTTDLHTRHFRRQFAEHLAHFHALGLSHDAGARKPRPAFYQYIQGLAGGEPGTCVFVDDLPANVEAARAFGWHAIQYRDGDDLRQRLAELEML